MKSNWDEEWEMLRPQARRRRLPTGMRAVFLVVLALMAVMVGATRWRGWFNGGASAPGAAVSGTVKPGVSDREQAQFVLCKRSSLDACVVDGDTIHYQGLKIRIADINTPETRQAQCDYEQDLGNKAKLRLVELLNAGAFSVEMPSGRATDKYGRALRVITRGGVSLGDVLVNEGLAERWTGRRRDWCH
ncbi:thermonuclease family protein [Novosphingobium sp. FSY-8]|uniref:Thermonuclease family protein n=1 Tax=Novosphingobium ovatum TaxID=1908523 RepID=A0ABW9XH26_9SPHN|nr:thermonuclease family protein [Novosphingobium ovatum]NBC37869.1 thermonuclease family protein [Novosphingobium ovatum]